MTNKPKHTTQRGLGPEASYPTSYLSSSNNYKNQNLKLQAKMSSLNIQLKEASDPRPLTQAPSGGIRNSWSDLVIQKWTSKSEITRWDIKPKHTTKRGLGSKSSYPTSYHCHNEFQKWPSPYQNEHQNLKLQDNISILNIQLKEASNPRPLTQPPTTAIRNSRSGLGHPKMNIKIWNYKMIYQA